MTQGARAVDGPIDRTVVPMAVERNLRCGFKDNHGRTWVQCAPGDTGGTFWNLQDGRRVRCRLKFPAEFNVEEVAQLKTWLRAQPGLFVVRHNGPR
jgi:hypothetical protein